MSQRKIIIIGAGGHAKDTALIINRLNRQIAGILDDGVERDHDVAGHKVLGPIDLAAEFIQSCDIVVAINTPRTRRHLVNRIKQMGAASFPVLVDPSANIGYDAKLEEGVVVGGHADIMNGTHLHAHAQVNVGAIIGHDAKMMPFASVGPQSMISGHCIVGSGVEVGTCSAIRQDLILGEGAVIGMGAIVTKNVEPNTLYVGCPATPIKELDTW